MQAQAMLENGDTDRQSDGRSFHETNMMFRKCANGNCPQAFQYFRGSVVFRVESPADSTIEYHWLCAGCLHIILISLEDHGTGTRHVSAGRARLVSLTSLDTALGDMAKLEETASLAEEKESDGMEHPLEMPGYEERLSAGVSPSA
jgi:hypothetical protein